MRSNQTALDAYVRRHAFIRELRRDQVSAARAKDQGQPGARLRVGDGSRADLSFVAGLLIDEFAYHLLLVRQHQRLTDACLTVSRPWLTQIARQGAALRCG